MKTAHRFFGVVLAFFLVSLPAFSQGESGRISGTITDQTGGAIVGATVTVTDVARGLSRTLTTDSSGLYAAPNLIPSQYTVQVTAMGFQVVQRQNVEVGVGSDIRIDLTLPPGAQTQTITVTGEAPAMNTTNAQTGGTLENNLIEALPINGGSYRALTAVLPGVTKLPGSGVDDQSTNGGATEWDNYMLDGLYDVSVWVNTATVGSTTSSGDTTLLPLDAIQAVNLIENPKAEYGYYPGVTVDVGLKSGTNDIHGSAWAFGRDTSLDARNAFSATRASTQFEQFGAVIGGPIKKNKLFYFAAFEGARYSAGYVYLTSAPTTASGPGTSNSIPDAIAAMNAAGVAFSTLSLNIAGCNVNNAAIKLTTGAGVAPACASGNLNGSPSLFANATSSQNFVVTLPDFGGSNSGLGKIDWKINDKHSFNLEYYVGDSSTQVPNATGAGALSAIPTEPWWEQVFDVYTRTGRVVEIWTPSSNWLNEARGGYDFQDQPNYNSECGNSDTLGHAGGPSTYGSSTYNLVSGADVVNGQQGCGFPDLTISGFAAKLDPASLRLGGGRDLQFADNVSYTHGTHQFKWGANLRKQCLCLEDKNVYYGIGAVAFGASGLLAPGTTTALESFLAGYPSSETIINAAQGLRNIHYNMIALFAQDDWRVTSRLTLNLGVRWEGETPGRDTSGRLGNFDPSVPSGMIQNNQLWPFQSSPSPHVGLAYDVTGKGTTVVRAGGSMAYVYQSMLDWTSLQADAPQAMPTGATLYYPNGTSLAPVGNITTFLSTETPTAGHPLNWTAGQAIFTASSFVAACGEPNASSNPFPQCTMFGSYPSYRIPYVSTWNLSVQHAFSSTLTLNVAYVGTHGTDLNLEGDINQPTPGINNTSSSTNEEVRRPYYANCPTALGGPGTGPSPSQCFPWFGKAVFNFVGGSSNYDGVQVTLAERLYHGLNFTAGYTLSHALGTGSGANNTVMDIACLKCEYGSQPIDFRNRFTFALTYAIPGRKSPGQILQGWTIVSNLNLMSTPAMTPIDSGNTYDTSGTGEALDRWNLTGPASNMDKIFGGAGPVPCFGVPNSKFAKAAGCTTVAAGAGNVGTPSFVANMPSACIAGAEADSSSNSGAWNLANNSTVPVQSTASLSTSDGYNGLAQLAELGCYYYNGTAITPPAQGTFGDMAPGALRNGGTGGFRNWDLSLQKNWLFKERFTVQFRAEAFNVINRTDYYLPNLALGSPGLFGESQSTPDVGKGDPITGLGGPREIQFGLKLLW